LTTLPSGKRSSSTPTVPMLQRELEVERSRHERLQESVEQLRLELQMMGRLLAAAREQLVSCGATAVDPAMMTRTPPASAPSGTGVLRAGRSKADAKRMLQMQDELTESRALCKRLAMQLEQQQQGMQLAATSKKELIGLVAEMSEYLASNRT
jgi:hypothetical protein